MGRGRRQDRVTRHIVGRLLELAVLAERAAGRTFLIRWFVLTLLAHGESVARSFVAERAGDAWHCLDEACDLAHDGTRWDALAAMHLAVRFRVLAMVLDACLHADDDDGHLASNLLRVDSGRPNHALAPHLLVIVVCRPRRHLDTS